MFELHQGDCLEVMKQIPNQSINLVLTDPPYGMKFQSNWVKSGPRHRKIEGDDKVDPLWIKECFRILIPNGGAILSFCDWNTSHIWRKEIEDAGFTIKSQVIWNRLHHGMGDLFGAFAPMHDVIWYATKDRRRFVNGRPKSVIESRRPSPSEDHGHPTCKPVPLLEELIRSVDDGKSGFVLDCFMGSGSTGVACANTGRRFIGIEKDEKYFQIAKKRVEEAYANSIF